MILTVTVDMSDFYSEEEGEQFSETIKNAIAREVKQSIIKDFKDKVGLDFNSLIAEEIEKHKKSLIQDTLDDLFLSAKVKKKYSSGEMISISDYIKDDLERTQFNSDSLKRTIDEQTKKSSALISEEFKKRYDLLFASQIVSKLNEKGMLKEDIAKILLA